MCDVVESEIRTGCLVTVGHIVMREHQSNSKQKIKVKLGAELK